MYRTDDICNRTVQGIIKPPSTTGYAPDDTLPHVTHLSKCLQIEAVDYSVIPAMLSSTISSLQQLISSDGPNLSTLQTYLEGLEQANITISKNIGENYFLEKLRILI